MKTFFQNPREEWTEFEKRAFEEIQNICNRHDGDAEARYGAWEAMVWVSSQPEVQSKWKPSEEQGEALKLSMEGRDKQEQLEVDLEKEIEEHVEGMPMSEFTHESEVEVHWDWARKEFRYFFERGLNVRKEE